MARIKYSLYKQSYADFPAHDYDGRTKTIEVDLPEVTKPKFPKEWKVKGSNYYRLPNSTKIYFWNAGLAEHFYIERNISSFYRLSADIPAGVNARRLAIETALKFDAE